MKRVGFYIIDLGINLSLELRIKLLNAGMSE
jgi:hypothetical protein